MDLLTKNENHSISPELTNEEILQLLQSDLAKMCSELRYSFNSNDAQAGYEKEVAQLLETFALENREPVAPFKVWIEPKTPNIMHLRIDATNCPALQRLISQGQVPESIEIGVC